MAGPEGCKPKGASSVCVILPAREGPTGHSDTEFTDCATERSVPPSHQPQGRASQPQVPGGARWRRDWRGARPTTG